MNPTTNVFLCLTLASQVRYQGEPGVGFRIRSSLQTGGKLHEPILCPWPIFRPLRCNLIETRHQHCPINEILASSSVGTLARYTLVST